MLTIEQLEAELAEWQDYYSERSNSFDQLVGRWPELSNEAAKLVPYSNIVDGLKQTIQARKQLRETQI